MRNRTITMIFFWIVSLMKLKTTASQGMISRCQSMPCSPLTASQLPYIMDQDYDKNQRPSIQTDVNIALYINRISGVDETKEVKSGDLVIKITKPEVEVVKGQQWETLILLSLPFVPVATDQYRFTLQELSFDVFLKVIWEDQRIRPKEPIEETVDYLQLTSDERHLIWVPDLYIRQLREMRVLSLFEEISSLRLYGNSTVSLSIGATIIIKCDMDFVLYPLDVQKCSVDFSSYKYNVDNMKFKWRDEHPLMYPTDSNDGFFRLPKYVVSFVDNKNIQKVNYGDADHWSARLEITLSREVKSYLLENYLPSTLFVSISWGSFVVVPDIVPGRMVLLVTTLLSLVTMFDTVSNNSPDALELKCIEVWLISCTLFVFLALMEYFIVLFGIRYDKHWRTAVVTTSSGNKSAVTGVRPLPSPIRLRADDSSIQINNEAPFMLQLATAASSSAYRRNNGLLNRNKVNPEVLRKDLIPINPQQPLPPEESTSSAITTGASVHQPPPPTAEQDEGAVAADSNPKTTNATTNTLNSNTNSRRRFRNVAEHAVLYAGSQRGRLDQLSLILFPLSFLIFTIVYWIYYLSESKKIK